MTIPKTIDLQSIEVKEELNQDIWDGTELRPEIRQRLLDIAQEFVDWLEVDVPIRDVLFTGSLANYNWSSMSDIDLHPLLDYSDIDENIDLVRDLMMARKSIWNNRYDINIKGHIVELYAQDINEPHHSTGVYSVAVQKWLREPSYFEPKIDMSAVQTKARAMMDMIELAVSDKDSSKDTFDRVKKRIKDMRQCGLETGGEHSIENLAFKALRRNGWLEMLYDEADERYVDELSLESIFRLGPA